MKIVAHRGFWKETRQANTRESLIQAALEGFEIETDVRDFQKKLVVAHDPPTQGDLTFEELLRELSEISHQSTIAVNIKADGLSAECKTLQDKYPTIELFFFDMSGPEHYRFSQLGLNCLYRISEFEEPFTFPTSAPGYWIDSFIRDEHILDSIERKSGDIGQHFIVSPELHGRSEKLLWTELKKLNLGMNFHLCTDYPLQAREFFEN